MAPAPSFRFLQLPDDLTRREAEYCIQLTKDLTDQYGYQKACQIAESLGQNFIDARKAAHKGPALNLIITALPIGVTGFSLDSNTGELAITLSDSIHDADLQVLRSVLNPSNIDVSGNRRTVSLSWK